VQVTCGTEKKDPGDISISAQGDGRIKKQLGAIWGEIRKREKGKQNRKLVQSLERNGKSKWYRKRNPK